MISSRQRWSHQDNDDKDFHLFASTRCSSRLIQATNQDTWRAIVISLWAGGSPHDHDDHDVHDDHAHLDEKDCSQANSSSNTEGLQSRHSADRTYLLVGELLRGLLLEGRVMRVINVGGGYNTEFNDDDRNNGRFLVWWWWCCLCLWW